MIPPPPEVIIVEHPETPLQDDGVLMDSKEELRGEIMKRVVEELRPLKITLWCLCYIVGSLLFSIIMGIYFYQLGSFDAQHMARYYLRPIDPVIDLLFMGVMWPFFLPVVLFVDTLPRGIELIAYFILNLIK